MTVKGAIDVLKREKKHLIACARTRDRKIAKAAMLERCGIQKKANDDEIPLASANARQ